MSTAARPPDLSGTPVLAIPSAISEQRLSQFHRARLAAEIVATYVTARRALKRAPIATVVAGLRHQPEGGAATTSGRDRLREARRLGRAVTRALRIVPGDTRCLMRALVLTRVLARRGIPSKLVIGARTTPSFFAHAWVEHAGQPVLAAGDGLFDRLVEL
jgi:Transglutaminase-like superfamily